MRNGKPPPWYDPLEQLQGGFLVGVYHHTLNLPFSYLIELALQPIFWWLRTRQSH